MPRKPKQMSMDAAFKSILREMDIPSQKDINKLNAKIDRLEKLLKKMSTQGARTKATRIITKASKTKTNSATAVVLSKINRSKRELDVEALMTKTGFDDKKFRNIVFRLHKLGKIKRVGRGKYTGV